MGVDVRGWVSKATILQQGHCKRNHTCTGGQKHGIVLNLNNIAHISAIFVPFTHEWELYANANETRVHQCEYVCEINKFLRIRAALTTTQSTFCMFSFSLLLAEVSTANERVATL